jgi:hypothetical protein
MMPWVLLAGCAFDGPQTVTTIDSQWTQSAIAPSTQGPAAKGILPKSGEVTLEGGMSHGSQAVQPALPAQQKVTTGHVRGAYSWGRAELGLSGHFGTSLSGEHLLPAEGAVQGDGRPSLAGSVGGGIDFRVAMWRTPRVSLELQGELAASRVNWYRTLTNKTTVTTTTWAPSTRDCFLCGLFDVPTTVTTASAEHAEQSGSSLVPGFGLGVGGSLLLSEAIGVVGGVLLRQQPVLNSRGSVSQTCDGVCQAPTLGSIDWGANLPAYVSHLGLLIRQGRFDFIVEGLLTRTAAGAEVGATAAMQLHFDLPTGRALAQTGSNAEVPDMAQHDAIERVRF